LREVILIMESPPNSSRRQHLRLWFEYLKQSYRLPELATNIARSRTHYAVWGNIQTVKFDDWWKDHGKLFGETSVQVITTVQSHANVIHLAVPLNVPISKTLRQVRGIVLQKQRARLEQAGKDASELKTLGVGTGQFELTPGVEIRGQTLYEILIILTAWIDMKQPAVNSDFCFEVIKRLKARKRSKWVPYLLANPPQKEKTGNLRFGEDQIRQIRRYLKRGMEVCRSVSLGEFPGKSRLR
jgi:hypothetical protein